MTGPATTVISGGSKGIGLAVALRLARERGRIAILGRRPDELDGALRQIRDAGASDSLAVATDTTNDQQVAAAFAQVSDRWGELNALVNAVGPSGAGRFSAAGAGRGSSASAGVRRAISFSSCATRASNSFNRSWQAS